MRMDALGRWIRRGGLVLLALLAWAGCAVGPQTVARVNGEPITRTEYERLLGLYRALYICQRGVDPYEAGQEALRSQLEAQALEDLIDQALIRQLAFREGIEISKEEVDREVDRFLRLPQDRACFRDHGVSVGQLRPYVRLRLLYQALQERHGQVPEAVEQVRVRHILLATRETAEEVRARLEAGEDFAELAREYSTDATSAQQGGDLGWWPRGLLIRPFDEAIWSLKVGEISEPVETRFGYHIIQVLDREVRPLPEEYRTPDLLQRLRQGAFQSWYEARRGEAEIERYWTP